MPDRPVVTHLIDDTTAGGVMRVLDHIKTSPEMADLAEHRFEKIRRGQIKARRHDGDIIVSHLSISWRTLPAMAALRAANLGKKLVPIEHSYTEGFVRHNVPNVRRFHALLRTGFSMFDAVVAVSHGQGEWLERTAVCPAKKLFVIQSCVDLSAFNGLEPARAVPKTIGAIGRLDRQKGFDTLVEGFKALPNDDIALHIYGTGDELHTLQDLAKDDPRIVFKGFSSDPLRPYEAVDMVVVPSRWEAYGLVAIEALSAGRIVLCADVDGLRDHTAFGAKVFDPKDPSAVTHHLEHVITRTDHAAPMRRDAISDSAETASLDAWKSLLKVMSEESSLEKGKLSDPAA